jgi:DNA gyrase subunit B
VLEYLRQQAYLTKGVRIIFADRTAEVPFVHSFYFEGGLSAYVKFLARDSHALQEDQFYVHKPYDQLEVEAAFMFVDDIEAREYSFANNIYTPDGGTHLTGFRSAMTRTLNNYARGEGYLKEKDENFSSDDTREGLIAVVSVKIPDPQFEGQTKSRLGSTEARTAVEAVVNEALKEFLEKHPSEARRVIEKVALAAKARKAAKAAKDTVLRKGALEGLTLPGKLADCTSRSAEESELFIVEGDSAGGSAKSARDRRTQAILPLRGKILNVERARLDKMLANQEIRSLVVAIGAAIADEFDAEKIRYHKIVLMSDADVDGAHIRTLLLTFFYRHFRKIVEQGYLYIAQPPLYRIQVNREARYAYNDAEKETILEQVKKDRAAKLSAKGKAAKEAAAEAEEEAAPEEGIAPQEGGGSGDMKGISIQRYKGLGEMNPEQLWETTLNPENRLLLQVTIDDAAAADHLFSVLMGDDVEPRKKFIQTQALAVKNLDI